jgi:hypothetical protein
MRKRGRERETYIDQKTVRFLFCFDCKREKERESKSERLKDKGLLGFQPKGCGVQRLRKKGREREGGRSGQLPFTF